VGQSFGANTARAFLYQDGVMTDINTLVQPASPLYLVLANDINDRGEIVGYATDTNTNATVAFLAVPISDGNGDAGNTEDDSRRMIAPDYVRRQMPGFGRFLESE
jgi:probable HAF family extracellular repeat protein